ncbi:MAG TPA: glycoside hydrolase family 19 protein [Patescibacteria group bacterium]|nr:glycoside hydrolase family 19 protein [Patescibacteria group bacterium]
MSSLTADQLTTIMPYATKANIALFTQPINDTFDAFSIDTPLRQACFLAQIGHESGSLRYVRELASGEAYEGRADLGNTQPGDGVRFKGRGLIQITGRTNYQTCGAALGLDLLSDPTQLEQPEYAAKSAGWFWGVRNLDALADQANFKLITRRINGGYNGFADRVTFYVMARKVLGLPPADPADITLPAPAPAT